MKSFLSTAALCLLEDSDVDTIKENLKNHRENRFLSYILDSSHSSSKLEDMIIEEEVAYIIQQRSNIPRYKEGTRSKGYRKGNTYQIIDRDLYDTGPKPWLNQREFKQKYRMSRESFWKIHELIKGHHVFKKPLRGPSPMRSDHQLLIFLAFLGMEGQGMSNKRGRDIFEASPGNISGMENLV